MDNYTVNYKQGMLCSSFLLKLCTVLVLSLFAPKLYAQLDYIHYVPPLYNGSSNSGDIGTHVAVITTNSESLIDVDIFKGGSDVAFVTVQVSKSAPYRYQFRTTADNPTGTISSPTVYDFPFGVIGPNKLNQVLNEDGLKFRSYDEPVYVNIRHVSSVQGGSLTTKGRFALGQEFRSGHVYTDNPYKATKRRAHFISVMATEDGTKVNISDLKSGILTDYTVPTDFSFDVPVSNALPEITLNKGQSYVIAVDHDLPLIDGNKINDMNGTHIVADKDIVVNTGSWTAGPNDGQDMGIDQIVPYDQIRDQYVVMQGQGDGRTERPIVVATVDDTYIYTNGAGAPINAGNPLSAGEHLVIPESFYTDPDGKGIPTMFIDTDEKNVYVYQTMSGSASTIGPTVGMNFIAPLAATGMHQVDVPYSGELAKKNVTAVVTILAQNGAEINYSVDGGPSTLLNESNATSIDGAPEWKSYKILNVGGHLSFQADKAINVAWTVQSGYIGSAGYYSGFSKAIPKIIPDLDVDLETDLDIICESYNENIEVGFVSTPDPDFYEWYRNVVTEDSLIFESEKLIEPAPDVPTTYILKAYYRDPALNINTNANFNSGQVVFTTGFDLSEGNMQDPGTYGISTTPKVENTSFIDVKPEEGREKMLIVYSDGQSKEIYKKEDMPIDRNTNYIISVVGRMAQIDKPQLVDVYINEERIKSNFLLNDETKWQTADMLWKSKDNQKATIKLIDANASGVSGVFAIDTVAFAISVEEEGEFNALVVPNYSFTPHNKPVHICLGHSHDIDISNGDTSWYNYVWEKKDGENYVPITAPNVTGADGHVLGFTNITNDNAGIYKCSITFKDEFQQCGATLDPATLEVEVVVDELAQILSLTGEADLCEGESVPLEVNVEGKYSRIAWSVNGVEKAEGKVFDFNLDKLFGAGVYIIRCDVENACAPSSQELTIEIFGKPNLSELQVPTDLCDQQAVNLTAVLDATPVGATLEYSWYQGSTLLATNNLSVFSVVPNMGDPYYKVGIEAQYNIGLANEHICDGNEKTVNLLPDDIYPNVVLTNLTPVTLCEGLAHLYTAELETSGDFYNYTWEVPAGVTGELDKADFSLTDITTAMAGNYKVTVSNRCGTANSTSLLTVTPKMNVTDITIDKEGPYCDGDDATITINATDADYYMAENVTLGQEQTINPITSPYVLTANAANEGVWEITTFGNCGTSYQEPFTINLLANFSDPVLTPNVTTCFGEDVSFEVQIETIPSGSDLTYTWTVPPASLVVDSGTAILDVFNVQVDQLGIYTCRVENKCGYFKDVSVTLSAESVTSALTSPAVEVCQGTLNHTFDIVTVGTPEFSWKFNNPDGVEIGTGSSYVIPTVELVNAGVYYCDITLACGTFVTYQRELIVKDHISVTEDPSVILDICEGEQTELIINVTGTPTSIKWFDNLNAEVPAFENKTRLLTEVLNTNGTYTYRYELTGDCENPTGDFDVVVHDKPSLNPIANIESCEGDVDLNMVIVGADFNASSWWNADESIKLQDGTSHTVVGMTYTGNLIGYTAVVNTDYCGDIKTPAQVYIYKPIAVVSNSDLNPEPCIGEPLSLMVEGEGDDLSYQWYKGAALLGETSNILDLGAVDLTDESAYRCKLVSGNTCGNVDVDFNVDVREHAKIILQPIAQNPCQDDAPVTFTVTGTAEDAPDYQWYNNAGLITNGGDYSGATLTTLTVSNLLGNDGDSYYCEVSGDYCDPIKSEKASLTVKKNVIITKDPVDVTIAEDGVATFTVEAEGTETLTYQWYDNGAPMGGETASTLTIDPAVIGLDGHKYSCKVSNDCSTDIASAEAILTVDPAIKITTQPDNQHVCVGEDYSFEVIYKNTAVSCDWEYSINDGATYSPVVEVPVETIVDASHKKSTITISSAIAGMDGWKFRALVKAPNNYSREVSVKVDVPATFDAIDDEQICNNSGVGFNVTGLSGSTPFVYEWKRGAASIGSNSSLNLVAADATDGNYSVEVKSGVCPVVTETFAISHYDDLVLDDLVHANALCPGGDINLSVGINTGPAGSATYAWSKDGVDLVEPTANYEALSITDVAKGTYKVDVTDNCMTQSKSIFIDVLDVITQALPDWTDETLCAGDELLLEAKVDGDNPTYVWTVPAGVANPGDVAILKVDAVTETNEGIYSCDITDLCGTLVNYTVNITINHVPNITTGIEALADVCENEVLLLGPIAYDATTGESIVWKFNDGILGGETSTSLDLGNAELAEEGNYRVEVTNACGTDFSIGFQDVNPIPTLADIDDQDACQGENVIVRAVATGENLTYRWWIDGTPQAPYDDETEIDLPNIQPTDANTPKTYVVKCEISSCGTNIEKIANITVNPNTILNESLKGEVVYVGADHIFDLDITGSNLTFEWHHIKTDATDVLLPETTKTLTINGLTMADAGEYTCKITGDCGTRFTSGYLTVKDPLKVVDGLNTLANIEKCHGEPLNLNIVTEGEIFSIKWFKGTTDLGHTELNYSIPAVDYLTDSGVYKCVISGEGATITETVNVIVHQITVLNSDLKDETICEDETLFWSPDVTGSPLLAYDWKHKGKTVSTSNTLEILNTPLDSAGIYSVDITGKCGDVSTEANLTVNELPHFISKSGDLERCENDPEAVFTVEYGGDNLVYQWQKDDVDIVGANNTEFKIQNLRTTDAGVYKCVVSSSCGFAPGDHVMNLVVIPQLKILSESSDLEICDGESAEFVIEVEGTDIVYQWQKNGVAMPGENTTQLTIDPASLTEDGYYSCEVSDKCTANRYSNSKRLKVNALPSSPIFGRMILCVLEDRVAYNATIQTDINYGWIVEGGDFTTPTEDVLGTKITWGDADLNGLVKLKIVDEATGCYSEVDSLVRLHALPDVTLTSLESKGICNNEFSLEGGLPAGGIYWVDGVAQNTFDPAQGNGEYNVRYSYTDGYGCSNSTDEIVMTIDSLPIVKVVEDVIVGSCETKMLSAETEENNIKWAPSRYLDDPNSETPTFTAGETTLYVATVVDKNGCVGNDIINVTVATLPLIKTINDTIIGECKEIELTSIISGDIEEINWTNADDLDTPNNSNPKLIKRHVGVTDYQINVTDEYGCVASESIKVEVLPNPEIGGDKTLCEGETLLINTKDLSNPVWSDGYSAWERVIDKPGEYELTVEQHDCELIQKIVMNPLPKFKLDNTVQPGMVIFDGQTVTLDPNLNPDYGPYVYEWSDGSVLSELEVSESGMYKLKVEDNLGCMGKDSVEVLVKPVGIESPNAFTPLSQNENDRFYLKDINVTDKFEMYIYNRWGELLYKTDEPGIAGGWDGTYKGEDCPVGTYVWVLLLDGKVKEKGTVTLLR